ncbi:MAG: amidohydrolase [Candidatus Aminicenantes bacterium]|nr:amidohydrolase [Candidatus Aminicenantes bacterium]
MWDDLRKDVEDLSGRLIAWRRELHRHPEVALKEEWTSAYLREHFKKLGLPVKKMAGTGLRAVLKGRPGGKTVALRTDIDALPLQEEGDKAYRSLNPGAAHACAHDGHMAVLLGVAKLLARRKGAFKGTVVFLCQPAEEHPPGGAKPMIEEGALKGVEAIFGLHLWQGMPTGTLGIVKGPMMAQSDNLWITVKGRGGHGALPHTTVDPVLAAAQLVVNLQSVVSRNVDPLKPAVLSFGAVHGGTANNIIPGEVKLAGTVRTLDPKVQALMKKRIREVIDGTCSAFGASADFVYEDGYPALVNDPASVDLVLDVAKRALGEENILAIDPVMGGEDFARYLQEVPGAFLFFGAGDGTKYPHHHPAFDFDEKALPPAAFLMTALALEYLK